MAGLVGAVGMVGLVEAVGMVELAGLVGLVGAVGLAGLVEVAGPAGPVRPSYHRGQGSCGYRSRPQRTPHTPPENMYLALRENQSKNRIFERAELRPVPGIGFTQVTANYILGIVPFHDGQSRDVCLNQSFST